MAKRLIYENNNNNNNIVRWKAKWVIP